MTEETDRQARIERTATEMVELIEAAWDNERLSSAERDELTEAFRLAAERIKRRHE